MAPDESDREETPSAPASEAPATRVRPAPHGEILKALSQNTKLPEADRSSVSQALERYSQWVEDMAGLQEEGDEKLEALCSLLNDYKRYIELDLIWDSPSEFLYRQTGQLKLENTILEEFLPWLVDPAIVPELAEVDCYAGPQNAFAAAFFVTSLLEAGVGAGLSVRTKDQDFTLSRPAYLKASFDPSFPAPDSTTQQIHLAYVAAECKTNLDKTMFQGAVSDAHDLKIAIPGSRYYLVCEYLDMTPLDTSATDIDEVLILRGQRMQAHLRRNNSDPDVRKRKRDEYVEFLRNHPVRSDVLARLVGHLRDLLTPKETGESDVLSRGYF